MSTFKAFQKQVAELVPSKFRYPRIFTALAIAEELGELAAELGRAEPSRSALVDELGDTLFAIAEAANEYGFLLEPTEAGAPRFGHDVGACIAHLLMETGRLCKCYLEIECFEKDQEVELFKSMMALLDCVLALAQAAAIDPAQAQALSLEKTERRLRSGKWEAAYGSTLERKKQKHD